MSTSSVPLVTIAIPTYNRASTYLPCALESALSQTYPHVEVVVSNNCSTDDTDAYLRAQEDRRLRYFRQDRPLTPNDNFNFCLAQARGQYFMLLPDDDMIDKDLVESCLIAARHDTSLGLIRTGVRVIDSGGSIIGESLNRASGLPLRDFLLAWFHRKTALYQCSTLLNTNLLRGVGGFHSRHNLLQDVIAELRLLARFPRVDVESVKGTYRTHAGERTYRAKVNEWCEDALDVLELMCNLVPDDTGLIRHEATRFLANLCYRRAVSVRGMGRRILAFLTVFRTFRCLPPIELIVHSSFPYRAFAYVSRRLR